MNSYFKSFIFLWFTIYSQTIFAHEITLDIPQRAFNLAELALANEELAESNNYLKEGLILEVVFLLDRVPSWVGLLIEDVDIRHGILRMYTYIALLKTETLRKAIEKYLYDDPYTLQTNKETMEISKRNFFDPLDIKKEAVIYALLRVVFNIPDNIGTKDDIPMFNYLRHGHSSYGYAPEDDPRKLLWPLYIDNNGNLILTGDYAFSGVPDYDYKKNLLLSFDYLNEKFGRRDIKPMDIELKQHNKSLKNGTPHGGAP